MSAIAPNPLADVQRELAEFVHDPLGFVMCAYPWGKGDLAAEAGPRQHQIRLLKELGEHLSNPETRYQPFRKAKSSGHGIGKTAEAAWLAHWGMSTFEDCKVIVMAGTGDQLKTKTQPEVAKWFRLGANADLFEVNVQSIKVTEPNHERWKLDFTTWSEENPQASAGAHNKGKRLIIIYEEAAGIPDVIWQTQAGALTDENTEIIWLAISQCTRSDGMFFEASHGTQRKRWRAEVIDSREVEGVNLQEIQESVELYGEESDYVRVRYRGLFPLAGEGKFIGLELVKQAQERSAVTCLDDDVLVAGVDLSWGGSDDTVIRFRRGLDARSIPPIKIRGEFTKNPTVVREKLADVLRSKFSGHAVAMMFLDNSGVGGNAGVILDGLLKLGFKNVMGINFGDQAIRGQFYVLRRDEMWGAVKDWLRAGGAIDNDKELAADLQKPILMPDREQRIKLEPKDVMKKRLAKMGLESNSPDDGDALALTFALPVMPKKAAEKREPSAPRNDSLGWMS